MDNNTDNGTGTRSGSGEFGIPNTIGEVTETDIAETQALAGDESDPRLAAAAAALLANARRRGWVQ